MLRDEYPPQRTNPARDLYKMWYALIQYHSPQLLRPMDPDDRWYKPASFVFRSGHSLLVDRRYLATEGVKPPLYIPDVMKVWPNGHFTPLGGAYKNRWHSRMLDLYQELTFLRWGYVNREKALWVQDTPRRSWTDTSNRAHPVADNWEARVPYLPLANDNLFSSPVIYRLKFTTAWIIVACGIDDPDDGLSETTKRRVFKAAQETLANRYAIAEKRYAWWQRRAELAAIREGKAEKPRKTLPPVDRAAITQAFKQHMTVYEPKLGPEGKPLARQLSLLTPMEVTYGRNDVESCSVAG